METKISSFFFIEKLKNNSVEGAKTCTPFLTVHHFMHAWLPDEHHQEYIFRVPNNLKYTICPFQGCLYLIFLNSIYRKVLLTCVFFFFDKILLTRVTITRKVLRKSLKSLIGLNMVCDKFLNFVFGA